jgi:predicted transcriptional regulator
MSTLTIRLPGDKHERLKSLAEARKITMNKLIGELATIALANCDARTRFQLRARKGSARKARVILDRLGDT